MGLGIFYEVASPPGGVMSMDCVQSSKLRKQLILSFSAESIETDHSIVMFVTCAWINVCKANISADLNLDTTNAAFVWR